MDVSNILLKNLKTTFMVLYVLVSIIALWRYRFYKHTALRYILFYVLLQMITEYVGNHLGETYGVNAWWYSCSYFFSFLYVYLIFKDGIQTKKFKGLILKAILLFVAAYVIIALIFGFDAYSNAYIFIVGASLAVGCVILFYIDLLKTNEIVHIKSNLLFWISVGLLLFYIGYVPIKSLYVVSASLRALDVFKLIHYTLIIIMNLCFITGFLLVKPRTQL